MSAAGLIVAAARSGAGKTTVALGLMRALTRRGHAVQPFKCGPDYIDPAFHAAATGRPGLNLDGWAMSAEMITQLAADASTGSDVAIAEGVMGLFDGAAGEGLTGRGATADLAALLGWPVVLVLDVSGQTETAAAVALGCMRYRQDVNVAGVILNRAASPRHAALITPALERIGARVFGVLKRDGALGLPERHLGLVQAGEHDRLTDHLDRLAEAISGSVDLDGIMMAARDHAPASAVDASPAWDKSISAPAERRLAGRPGISEDARSGKGTPASGAVRAIAPPGQRIALAQDVAFSFVYPHMLDAWRAAGAEILPFSPLADEAPPPHADAVWLPGGYPELHAGRLAAALRFREGLRRLADQGVPIHGECGGYMVLGEGLEDAQGTRHLMTGLLSLEISFARRRLSLGYRRAKLLAPCALGQAGAEILGHEFHYAVTLSSRDAPLAAAVDAGGTPVEEQGARRGSVSGTFLHAIAGAERS